MLPWESFDDLHLLNRDRFGSNNGNLIYQYSVIRALMTEDVEFYSDEYATNPNNAEKINETYDAYILPFADAFRSNFMGHLRQYTELIKKLEIPVIVIGIGVKAPFGYDITKGFDYDNDVKDFVEAVLEKSSIIGLRGQITGDYLEHLGFTPEKDFTVIGCPSMYTFGRDIKLKEINLNSESLVSLNASNIATQETMLFLDKVSEQFKNYYFIPQSYLEFTLNYFGTGAVKNVVENFPQNISSKYYSEGRVKYFLNAPTWFDFMKKIDLSIGTRLHGNIVATINGTPSITIVHDTRMKELADYHKLPAITLEDINENTKLENLIEEIDFKAVSDMQPKRFDHYIAFLEQNNLNHIYKADKNVKEAPLDKKVNGSIFESPIATINSISKEEQERRLIDGYEVYMKRLDRLRGKKLKETEAKLKKIEVGRREIEKELQLLKKDYSNEIDMLNQKNTHLEATLNRKLIKMARSFSDSIANLKRR